MKNKLLVTTKGGLDNHNHIVYLNDITEQYYCLPAGEGNGHVHEIIRIEPETVNQEALVPANPDPQTGEPLTPDFIDQEQGILYQAQEDGSFLIFDQESQMYRPLNPGGFVIAPEEGHDHDGFREYEPKQKKNDIPQDQLVKEVFELYKYACENDRDSITKGRESYEFWKGKQWTEALKRYLEGLDRACITINKIPKIVDTFIGYLIENRQDVTYTPVEEGDALAAEICTRVLKIIYAKCNYHQVEVDVFYDDIITGRGFFDIYLDRNSHIEGELKVRARKWDSVKCLEHESKDLSDLEALFKEDYYSLTKLIGMYPDKEDDLRNDLSYYENGYDENEDSVQTKDRSNGDHYSRGSGVFSMPKSYDGSPMVDIARKDFKVITRWMKVYQKGMVFVDSETGYNQSLKGWSRKDINKLKEEISGGIIIEQDIQRMRITKVAGNTVLSDENVADLPVDDFFVVPAYAYFKDGAFWGKVEQLKDPQRELNQRRSQIIDIGNRCTAYGFIYDDDTFQNKLDLNRFLQTATKPGAVWKVNDTGRPFVKLEGMQFPSELVQMVQMAEATIDSLGDISVEPSDGSSGEHLLQIKQSKLTSNAIIFENFKLARKKLAELMLPLIYRYYTPERIYYMLTSDGNDLMGRPIAEFTIEDIETALNNTSPDSYKIQVIETEYSPTTRLATQMTLVKLAEAGYNIPPESIISTLDMPAKEKRSMLETIEASKGSETQNAQMQVDGEVEKTLIAQGVVPPSVQQRLQLDQSRPIADYQGQAGILPQGSSSEFPTSQEQMIPEGINE